MRTRVVERFLQEKPGTGKGDSATKYDYVVETLAHGETIILTRPANLKNGFDLGFYPDWKKM